MGKTFGLGSGMLRAESWQPSVQQKIVAKTLLCFSWGRPGCGLMGKKLGGELRHRIQPESVRGRSPRKLVACTKVQFEVVCFVIIQSSTLSALFP